jgi:serine/threonine protein kinase
MSEGKALRDKAPDDNDRVRKWLNRRWFEHYQVEALRFGTYGTVWVMSANAANIYPHKFALKTLNLNRKQARHHRDLDNKGLFERELRVWLDVPGHDNVVHALGLEFAENVSDESPVLPFMRMAYCDASLKDWIEAPKQVETVDRLIALAQVCNGLTWLYDHQITGHGDLKPDNVLVRDLRQTLILPDEDETFPGASHPWLVKISDLGWADVWRDLGYTDRAWRPYLAPERQDGRFEPIASDMFAVGILGVELLQGQHPAGVPTHEVAKWSAKRWLRWARHDIRDLSGVRHPRTRAALDSCMAPDARERPGPGELARLFSEVVEHDFGIPVKWFLESRNDDAKKAEIYDVSGLEEIAKLSGASLDHAILLAADRLSAAGDIEATSDPAKWLVTWRSFGRLLVRRGGPADRGRVVELARDVLRFTVRQFGNLDLRAQSYPSGVPEELKPEEVIGGFGHEALRQVERAQGFEPEELRGEIEAFREKWRSFTREELKPLRERLEAEGKTRLLRVLEAFLERSD